MPSATYVTYIHILYTTPPLYCSEIGNGLISCLFERHWSSITDLQLARKIVLHKSQLQAIGSLEDRR